MAQFIVVSHTQGAKVRITQCYLQITPYLPLPRKHSPDGAFPDWGCGHLIAAYYSFIYPKRMKGWVGLVGWPTADGLPTQVVTRQPQVKRRTAKVRLSETDVLPRNQSWSHLMFYNNFGMCGPISKIFHKFIHEKILYVYTSKMSISHAIFFSATGYNRSRFLVRVS